MHRFWLLAGTAGLISTAVFIGGFLAGIKYSFAGFMLVYLSPAPLFAAALGLGGSAGIVAAVTGTIAVIVAGGAERALGYAALAAAPAAVLGRQAMLSRAGADGKTEWYPPGALVGWLCGVGTAIYALMCALLSARPAGLSGTVMGFLTELAGLMQVPDNQMDLFLGLLHPILPGTAVAALMLIQVANGALAQGLLSVVGRAIRPAPDLGELELPGWVLTAGAVAALAALVLGGDLGYFSRNLVIVAAVPFFLQGLSVVHVLARKTGGGGPLLAIFYVTLIVLGWIAVVLVLLGLVEQVARLRQRMNRSSGA